MEVAAAKATVEPREGRPRQKERNAATVGGRVLVLGFGVWGLWFVWGWEGGWIGRGKREVK